MYKKIDHSHFFIFHIIIFHFIMNSKIKSFVFKIGRSIRNFFLTEKFRTAMWFLKTHVFQLYEAWRFEQMDRWHEGMTEWKRRYGDEVKMTFVKWVVTLLVVMGLICMVYIASFAVSITVFAPTRHLFDADQIQLATYEHIGDVPHIISCKCEDVRNMDLMQGLVVSGGAWYSLFNILEAQEAVLKNSDISMPKLWTSASSKDANYLQNTEFNPCILSIRKNTGNIVHLINPRILNQPDDKRMEWLQSSKSFPFAGKIRRSVYSKARVRALSPEHGGHPTTYEMEEAYSVLLQFGVDMLMGEWWKSVEDKIKPMNDSLSKTGEVVDVVRVDGRAKYTVDVVNVRKTDEYRATKADEL